LTGTLPGFKQDVQRVQALVISLTTTFLRTLNHHVWLVLVTWRAAGLGSLFLAYSALLETFTSVSGDVRLTAVFVPGKRILVEVITVINILIVALKGPQMRNAVSI
jgi:hypothetical protein